MLIGGPATAGTGLLILSFIKQTSGPEAYWTTFFPGIFIFGLGMSFTVTPLTTTVMAAVNEQFSGMASGVNNAVSRIAGVFANAVFGALAILFFSGALQDQLKQAPLSNQNQQLVMSQVPNLGNAKVPMALRQHDRQLVKQIYHAGFIAAYARIMRIATGLCFLGALMAYFFIKRGQLNL